jgi:hypothetical protein
MHDREAQNAPNEQSAMVASDAADWRGDAARTSIAAHRASVLNLPPTSLSQREVVTSFVIATRIRNHVDRRVSALRKVVDGLFAASEPKMGVGVREKHMEVPAFAEEAEGVLVVRMRNGAANDKTVSQAKASELLARKRLNPRRHVFERVPRPPQPPPAFSAEKFRALVTGGLITQAEYDACLEPAPPSCSVTVELPPEFDAAIANAILA